MINNIKIKNVKGYGDPEVSLDLELKTNRINLLFAPNGTGKSSLAAAFRSLTAKALVVEKELKYHKDETLRSSLSLEMDGVTYTADDSVNNISPVLSCYVIKNNTEVHTTQKNLGKFTSVSGYIDIIDIDLEVVPQYKASGYAITSIRKQFGKNGKILDNLSEEINSKQYLYCVKSIYLQLDAFPKAKSRMQLVSDVVSLINSLDGTTEVIRHKVQNSWFDEIEANQMYQEITLQLTSLSNKLSRLDKFLLFYQTLKHWGLNRSNIKMLTNYREYEDRKSVYDSNLQLLNSSWKNISTAEVKGRLVVLFPQEDEISNGQRDLLTFIVELIKFKMQIKPGKKYLLMIDEVFDYLDDANLIAAQYYLSTMLDQHSGNVYLCLLSHLNPFTFRSYVFSEKKLNPQYLKKTIPTATLPMMAYIAFRERMHSEGMKGDVNKNALYHNLSHDLFHYNPVAVDYSSDIQTLKDAAKESHLNPDWGKTTVLHNILICEANNYLSGNQNYDPYAVAMALRLRVEKLMYERLPDQQSKDDFVNEKMTKNKFAYCNNLNVIVPDVYYIVSAIHNDADHLKYDVITNQYTEKPMVYKLQHKVIYEVICKLFDWHGVSLASDVID